MNFIKAKLNQFLEKANLHNLLATVIYGIIGTLLVKDSLTPLLFEGRGFSGRGLLIRGLLFSIYFLCFVVLFFFIQWLYHQFIATKETSDPTLRLTEPSKTFVLALIILSLGIAVIFIGNNLINRIDTENWKLQESVIIPIMEPIGNDFRIGLYQPAEYLVKSGFKAIGPNGTYPSFYPPLVNVLSVPYLLFDAQTAYMVHTVLLIIMNLSVLLISTLLVNELLLKKVRINPLVRTVLSALIFCVMAFYNFSSYFFLFSMERGNVDIIAMFFLMLSIWILVKQPDNVWLQVIFLSVAAHYKVYPAILFLVLLYRHGKKMILPTITVNLVFLFILGPKMAWAFIASLTSVGQGADTGNYWSWAGNHSAASFAYSFFETYPQLAISIKTVYILCILIPVIIWILGTINILRKKYIPVNAILLLMISLPLMDLLPTISNDYRLVIQSTTFILFIGLILSQIIKMPSGRQIVELLMIVMIMFFVARPFDLADTFSYGLKETSSILINNKYVWILALESIMVWNLFTRKTQDPGVTN